MNWSGRIALVTAITFVIISLYDGPTAFGAICFTNAILLLIYSEVTSYFHGKGKQ